ncbi:hypothetical protein [Cardiobacterium hominis]|uniref:hypothetical protein n=1 Tax=Cardiobacterium hominis TaxID=2718 RepID=UPI0028D8D944|nr:hypothetical protein [Cardiobacterium hominis]
MKHYSDVIANLGREARLLALRERYYISRESRRGNLPQRAEQTIPLPAELNRAEALTVLYAQTLHWGIANPYAKSMGHNRYLVFPARGMRFFLVEILPGELPGYRLQNLSADLQPLESLRSWLKEKEAGKDTIAPIPLIRGKCYFHQADSGHRFAIHIGETFDDYWQTTTPYLADVVLLPEHGDPASHLWQQAVGWGLSPYFGTDGHFDGDNVPF